GLRYALSAHADDVEPDQMRERTLHRTPGNDVGAYAAQAYDHGAYADAHELAHRGAAAEDHAIADADMSAKQRVVREYYAVADLAVVTDVTANHHHAAIADLRDAAVVLGAGVDGDVLADVAFRADHESGRTAPVFDGLGRRAKRTERLNDRAWPDRGVTGDTDMPNEATAIAKCDIRADGAIGTNRAIASDDGPICDPGRRIDLARAHISEIMAPTSASATTRPPTLASPLYHHMFRRWALSVMWYSIVSPGTTGRRNFALSIVMK